MSAEWFAARLKELREQSGMSQKALAEKAGLVTSAIGHLEQRLRKPTWETVLALASALGVEVGAFTIPPAEAPAPERGRPRKTPTADQQDQGDADQDKQAASSPKRAPMRKRKGKK